MSVQQSRTARKVGVVTRGAVAPVLALALSAPVFGGSHLWDFWEIYSNADGSIQFIELHVPVAANGEIFMASKKITSLATGNVFTFPTNLTPPTGFKHLLLATQTFADLPGAPTPDFIIPSNFFSPQGDTLKWHVYDTFVFAAGELPMDCVHSLNRDHTTGENSPENYGDVKATVNSCACAADLDGTGTIDGADLGVLLGAWGPGGDADLNGDGIVDGADLGMMLGSWGDCPT